LLPATPDDGAMMLSAVSAAGQSYTTWKDYAGSADAELTD